MQRWRSHFPTANTKLSPGNDLLSGGGINDHKCRALWVYCVFFWSVIYNIDALKALFTLRDHERDKIKGCFHALCRNVGFLVGNFFSNLKKHCGSIRAHMKGRNNFNHVNMELVTFTLKLLH